MHKNQTKYVILIVQIIVSHFRFYNYKENLCGKIYLLKNYLVSKVYYHKINNFLKYQSTILKVVFNNSL